MSISVVINTLNEENNIEKAIKSVKWADEVIVCDMYSDDRTVLIAKKLRAKVYYHKRMGYVEPARNFAISKATSEWILLLDADEEVSESLKEELVRLSSPDSSLSFIEIPRKNIIFNTWIEHSGWWPDYNIRFFKKKSVIWNDTIHSIPKTSGNGFTLEPYENIAIIHYNYQSISQYIKRMDSYSSIQADELIRSNYRFIWQDLVKQPFNEFLSRFFAREGHKDGLHGLILAILQSFSTFVVYLKVWEKKNFMKEDIDFTAINELVNKIEEDTNYWIDQTWRSKNIIHKIRRRVKKII